MSSTIWIWSNPSFLALLTSSSNIFLLFSSKLRTIAILFFPDSSLGVSFSIFLISSPPPAQMRVSMSCRPKWYSSDPKQNCNPANTLCPLLAFWMDSQTQSISLKKQFSGFKVLSRYSLSLIHQQRRMQMPLQMAQRALNVRLYSFMTKQSNQSSMFSTIRKYFFVRLGTKPETRTRFLVKFLRRGQFYSSTLGSDGNLFLEIIIYLESQAGQTYFFFELVLDFLIYFLGLGCCSLVSAYEAVFSYLLTFLREVDLDFSFPFAFYSCYFFSFYCFCFFCRYYFSFFCFYYSYFFFCYYFSLAICYYFSAYFFLSSSFPLDFFGFFSTEVSILPSLRFYFLFPFFSSFSLMISSTEFSYLCFQREFFLSFFLFFAISYDLFPSSESYFLSFLETASSLGSFLPFCAYLIASQTSPLRLNSSDSCFLGNSCLFLTFSPL